MNLPHINSKQLSRSPKPSGKGPQFIEIAIYSPYDHITSTPALYYAPTPLKELYYSLERSMAQGSRGLKAPTLRPPLRRDGAEPADQRGQEPLAGAPRTFGGPANDDKGRSSKERMVLLMIDIYIEILHDIRTKHTKRNYGSMVYIG